MRIASKLNAGVLVILAGSVLANYFVLQATIRPQFDAIESAESLANHKRILGGFEQAALKVGNSAQDYAFWEEAYDFARGKGKRFIAANLSPAKETLQSLNVNTVIYTDSKGEMLWGEAFDPSADALMPGFAREVLKSGYAFALDAAGSSDAKARTGLVTTSRGLMHIAAAPILRGDHSGPAAGSVIIASFVDMANLEQVSGIKFELDTGTVKLPAPSAIETTHSAGELLTASTLYDVSGRPIATLKVKTPREVSKAGAEAIDSAVRGMLMAAGLVIVALWLLVRLIVIRRIGRLKDHFVSSARQGRLSSLAAENSSDELGELSSTFNEMAEQVNHLRDALADSAYLSGLSEWAAGTLHNVRNCLSPINVTAWKLQRLFDDTWLANLKTTVKQLDNQDLPEDLRGKLMSYLVVSTSRMIERAEQTKAISGEIMSASRTAEDIFAEFDRHSRHETTVEPVDLLPLIEDVCRKNATMQLSEVELTLPEHSATIVGNRTIIRQILSNLVTNSLEALAGRTEGKAVTVSLELPARGERLVALKVSDNGEGIAPDAMKRIFRRGYSTRQHKHGGLGLHWCANAANGLGGALTAESAGPAKGATFTLNLPLFQPLEKAA